MRVALACTACWLTGSGKYHALFFTVPTIDCDTSVTVKDNRVQHIPCLCGLFRILLQRHKIVREQGFRTHRGQMRSDSLTAFLHLMHNRGPLPTFHNE